MPQPTSQIDGTGIRIMPLGDSITQANGNHNSYRRPLWFKLREAGYTVNFVGSTRSHLFGNAPNPDFDQDHEGHWGWRVDEILREIETWTRAAKPDIVLIHLGTNDVLGGESLDSTIEESRQLITKMRQQNPRLKILLAQLIPASGAEPLIQRFNQRIVPLARSLNTSNSPIWVVDQFSGFDPTVGKDTYDGLHPTAVGEQKIADRWFEALRKVLPAQR
jgi:lysophospholipase L1-like esterase